MKTIQNHHGNSLYINSTVYYGKHIATVIDVYKKTVKIKYTDFNFKEVTMRINPLKVFIPLITNSHVSGVDI